jgi:hypothetical protein
LSDRPREGTLLANLTWFLGMIVYRGEARYGRLVVRQRRAVARELRDYDYVGLPTWRIEERPRSAKVARPIVLRTDVVVYPHPPRDPSAEAALLIYSVGRGRRADSKLITAFPIRRPAIEELQQSASQTRAPIRPRYNAYVPEWPAASVPGRREMIV